MLVCHLLFRFYCVAVWVSRLAFFVYFKTIHFRSDPQSCSRRGVCLLINKDTEGGGDLKKTDSRCLKNKDTMADGCLCRLKGEGDLTAVPCLQSE